ncbi:MAG: ABC transporter substrate-binding protein [Hyphomonadaceae bacterium]|nr:ABC transporter substrate-binding protein [Hyphomonadaceae bacterium]
MNAPSITRAMFLASLTGAALFAAAPEALAARNANAEAFVQQSAQGALTALAGGEAGQRNQTFHTLMAQLADMPRIANYVLGRYGGQLRADAALRSEWNRTFQEYAIAVYEAQLDSYSNSTLRVTGSTERVAGQDVIVMSEMTPRGGSRPLRVQWRVLRSGEVWKVVDVSLVYEGNEVWLAQQQQRDFLAQLDRNNGDIRALITSVRYMTQRMRARVVART